MPPGASLCLPLTNAMRTPSITLPSAFMSIVRR
jgi:hypothetical protein